MLKLMTAAAIFGSVAASCDPCELVSEAQCIANAPCPRATQQAARFRQAKGLPMLWDNSAPDPEDDRAGRASTPEQLVNPFNSLRPEYRDEPPSHKDLDQIWQHHLTDHVYKTPFVRNMKSGLWEAGVPNMYAAGGYNRRKFKSEEEALKYVRMKSGSGQDLDYGKPTEARFRAKEQNARLAFFFNPTLPAI